MVSEKPFGDDDPKKETAEIKLEDKDTGDLFAAAPYDTPQVRAGSATDCAGVRSGTESVSSIRLWNLSWTQAAISFSAWSTKALDKKPTWAWVRRG